jgi:hypothetical protein
MGIPFSDITLSRKTHQFVSNPNKRKKRGNGLDSMARLCGQIGCDCRTTMCCEDKVCQQMGTGLKGSSTGVFRCPRHQEDHHQEMLEVEDRKSARQIDGQQLSSTFHGKTVAFTGDMDS